ncbi:hypothetical protein ACTL6U_03995 [Rhodovibrionaceae bacterium A322]
MRYLLSILFSFLLASVAFAADKVTVRGGQHSDFARMVFDWASPTTFQAEVQGDKVIVTFNQAGDYDFSDALRRLFANLSDPVVSADGKVVTFKAKGISGAKTFTIGTKVVVDLSKGTAPAAAPEKTAPPQSQTAEKDQAESSAKPDGSAPKPTAAPSGQATASQAQASAGTVAPSGAAGGEQDTSNLPVIKARLGEHPDFDRIVFDWPQAVGYRLIRKGDEVEVLFDRPGRIDLKDIEREKPKRMTAARSQVSDPGVIVTLRVPIDSQVKGFTAGSKVVIDVFSADLVRRSAEEDVKPAPTPKKEAKPEPEAEPKRLVVEPDEPPAKAQVAKKPESQPKSPQASAPTPLMLPDEDPRPELPEGGLQPLTPAEAVAEELRRDLEKVANLGKKSGVKIEVDQEEARRGSLPSLGSVTGSAGLVITADRESDAPNLAPVPGRIAPWPDPLVITFAWDAPVGLSLLKRGREIVLAFDRKAPRGAESKVKRETVELAELRRRDTASGTVFRFPVSGFIEPLVKREGDSWILDLRSRPIQQSKEIKVFPDSSGKRVIFDVVGAHKVISLPDPSTGEELMLVPLMRPGQVIMNGREFPEFSVLPTAQGLAMQRHTDDIDVSVVKGGVEVIGRNGLTLALSEGLTSTTNQPVDVKLPVGRRLFDLDTWRVGPKKDFNRLRQELQMAVVQADRQQKGLSRIKLAQFYFAHGLSSETLGVLALVKKENPELYGDPQVVLMEAASRIMTGDYVKARDLLERPVFAGEIEADLWRGVLAASAQEWDVAAPKLAATEALFKSYPRPIRQKLRLLTADAQITVGSLEEAERLLNEDKKDYVTRLEKAKRAFLLGQLDYAKGEKDAAKEAWTAVAGRNAGGASARARLALIDSDIEANELSAKDAIEKLEQLRFAWRGDDFEFALLTRLANLYSEEKKYRESLHALRRSATYFPGRASSEQAAQRMSREFERLFIEEKAKTMAPLAALSLYEEFRELTPPGKDGDDLIANIADRLVDVDLLGRAASLLEHQIEFRLIGEEKARVGARLAVVRLLDRKPQEALDALEDSRVANIPVRLAQERKHLAVRALADLGQNRRALAMLADDQSRAAFQLKSEIYWRNSQWDQAAQALAATLPPPPAEDGGTLTKSVSAQVINLSVALTLAGHEKALKELAGLYGPAMLQGPNADAFTLLAGQGAVTGGTSITGELAKIERVQAFMANYREKLTNTPLSAIN